VIVLFIFFGDLVGLLFDSIKIYDVVFTDNGR
jgi:hypothetical protein